MKNKWKKEWGKGTVDVIATDLKQMYTFLDHNEIKQALLWLLSHVHTNSTEKVAGTRDLRKRNIYIRVEKTSPFEVTYTNSPHSTEDTTTFTLSDLYQIAEFDLEHSYSVVGNQRFKQTNGCPIGRLLSALYGNLTCAFHEWQFLSNTKLTHLTKHIEGIRQMDDLIIFIGHKQKGERTKRDRRKIKTYVAQHLYKGGLEAEIEEPFFKNKQKIINHFAGHEIHTNRDLSDIYTKTLNTNRESIIEHGKQTKIRYPYNDTYANPHIKSGFIIGALCNIKATCTYRHHFTQASLDLTKELTAIGYKKNYILKVIEKLAHTDEQWKIILTAVRHRWNKPFETKIQTTNPTLTTPLKYRQNEQDTQLHTAPTQ